ncbi:hypothetical protein [Bradyrhizobium genosp. SA-3]|uniref:hypothetical protein n=1 Tax=Bradyrhizobium genosp. SA-3 TaxID=508868 RepID=UPI001028B423|nr:hypothetical protein [Bradyrhizobium genosp. SA-3]
MRLWLTLIVLCLVSQARAAEGVLVIGAGQRSCGQFIAAVGQTPVGQILYVERPNGKLYGELIRYHEWMEGFISGFNSGFQSNIDDQVRIDLSSMDLWMRNWCNAHPTKTIADAGLALTGELAPRR